MGIHRLVADATPAAPSGWTAAAIATLAAAGIAAFASVYNACPPQLRAWTAHSPGSDDEPAF